MGKGTPMNATGLDLQQLKAILEFQSEGVIYQRADGRILLFNKAAQQIFGLSEEDAYGRTSDHPQWHLVHEDGSPCPGEEHPSMITLRTGRALNKQILGIARAGQPITWISINTRSVMRADQKIPEAVIIRFSDITQKKQSDDQLRETEHRLSLSLEAANVGFWDMDLQDLTVYFSPIWFGMLGYGPDELPSSLDTWQDLLHPEDRERVLARASETISGVREDYEQSFRMCTKSGDYRWILSTGKVMARDAKGNPLRMLGTHVDITELKQAEESLREQGKVLSDILDDTLSGYWDWNIPANTEYMSPAFKKMFGYEDHELINSPETWQRLIFPEDLPGVLEAFDRHVKSRGEQPYYNEVRYRHKNGSTVWVICAGRIIEWGEDGSPIRMVGCHVDISDRKRDEARLAGLNQRLRLLLDMASDGIHIHDLDGKLVEWSDSFRQMLGYDQDEMAGLSVSDWDVHFNKEELASWFKVQMEEPIFIESVHRRRDGSRFRVEINSRPIELDGNNYIYASARDITERKRTEEALRDSEEKFRSFSEQSLVGIYLLKDGIFKYVNPKFAEIFGYSVNECLDDMHFSRLVHPEDRALVGEQVRRRVRGEVDSVRYEFRGIKKNGQDDSCGNPWLLHKLSGGVGGHRDHAGYHRAQTGRRRKGKTGETIPPGPEDGGNRHLGGWHGPRLQQHPGRDFGLCRNRL
jgi:PAS domain S-box-containing protein